MDASDVIAVSSTFVALGALVLTGYIARVNLEHQRVEAHRGRVWERKVDVILEFLEWVEMDAADGRPVDNADDPLQQAPRIPTSLHSRLTAFVPEFGQEIAGARLAVGKWRHVGALCREGRASQADFENAMNDAGVRLEHLRGLAKNEVREVPYFAEAVRPHLLDAIRRYLGGRPSSRRSTAWSDDTSALRSLFWSLGRGR